MSKLKETNVSRIFHDENNIAYYVIMYCKHKMPNGKTIACYSLEDMNKINDEEDITLGYFNSFHAAKKAMQEDYEKCYR